MNKVLLNQFGAILTFAIKLETDLSKYYDRISSDGNEEMKERSKASIKRAKNIERSRRENVTEITLEAIEGVDSADYILNLTESGSDIISTNEHIMCDFYRDVGPKINVLETRRLFKRCLKEHEKLI